MRAGLAQCPLRTSVTNSGTDVSPLVAMGFSEQAAQQALGRADGNMEVACHMLLGQ